MAKKIKVAPFWGCMISLKYPQMELAIRRISERLNIELVDLDGFTCCPDPIYFKARDKMQWLTIGARNLSIAEEAKLDIITACSGCTATLKEVKYILNEEPELKAKVNERLARINREYKGTVNVKHIVTLLRDDVGLDAVKASVTRPLENIRVGVHYGCHLLKPSQVMQVDDADYPTVLNDLLAALGTIPLSHTEKLLCCGKGCMDAEISLEMTYNIFASMEEENVDCMGLICPTCFSSFDTGQLLIARKLNRVFDIPVIYYAQMLGLAQGFSVEEVGLHLHRIKVDKILEKVEEKEAELLVVAD